ncbi:uncharacterized protein C10orf95-like [Rousettus aegyptiacus]|uniref:uncharacterized protein C10orf95-like n=1 Tax=Rousettus aegyptiacus TaxID=9407 RepID=UPI00168D1109|nr:uncharacterized protein C10orf95-like [Rousettus aegyptiacus]
MSLPPGEWPEGGQALPRHGQEEPGSGRLWRGRRSRPDAEARRPAPGAARRCGVRAEGHAMQLWASRWGLTRAHCRRDVALPASRTGRCALGQAPGEPPGPSLRTARFRHAVRPGPSSKGRPGVRQRPQAAAPPASGRRKCRRTRLRKRQGSQGARAHGGRGGSGRRGPRGDPAPGTGHGAGNQCAGGRARATPAASSGTADPAGRARSGAARRLAHAHICKLHLKERRARPPAAGRPDPSQAPDRVALTPRLHRLSRAALGLSSRPGEWRVHPVGSLSWGVPRREPSWRPRALRGAPAQLRAREA